MPHKREKGIVFLLAALLTLCACAAPTTETVPPAPSAVETPAPSPTPTLTPDLLGFPMDDTHDAFEVPTGGTLGTVLVTVETKEPMGEGFFRCAFSVWSAADLTKPIQTFEEYGSICGSDLIDANFDGYMDFCYTYYRGASNATFDLYLWDEVREQFAFEEEFFGTGLVANEESEQLCVYCHESAFSGVTEIWRWENDELVCERLVRVHYPEFLEDGAVQQLLTVEDHANGEMTEVYRKMFGDPNESEEIYAEATLWFDLDYRDESDYLRVWDYLDANPGKWGEDEYYVPDRVEMD